jgi:anti-sigma factor (TIGR02949 family)
MLSCKDVLDDLSDFIDGEVSPEMKKALEEHLAKCRRCSLTYSTTRKALRIVGEAGAFEIPIDMDTRLLAKLRELLARK